MREVIPAVKPVLIPGRGNPVPSAVKLNDGDPFIPGEPGSERWHDNEPHPWKGKKCNVRGCRSAVSWREVSLKDESSDPIPEWPSPYNALTVQLENAVQRAHMVAVQVKDKSVYWCDIHWHARESERMEAAKARRAEVDPLSRPLHELDHTSARIEMNADDFGSFFVSDAKGNRIKLPMCQLQLAQIYQKTGVVAW